MLADAQHVVIGLARLIQPGDVVFTGVNSAVPTAACLLAKRTGRSFTHLNVAGGVDVCPPTLPASSGDPRLVSGTSAIFPNEDFYDLCARGRMDIAFLGAAQIDADGHTNVSAIGSWHSPKVRLPGGGGAAVMMPTARRSVIWQTSHSRRGLVAHVDFATASGATHLVTPWAIFQRPRNGRFALVSHRPDQPIEAIRANTGFEFASDDAVETAEATQAELESLEELDADGVLGRCFGERSPSPAHRPPTK